jgi:hypothetical protein
MTSPTMADLNKLSDELRASLVSVRKQGYLAGLADMVAVLTQASADVPLGAEALRMLKAVRVTAVELASLHA